MKQILFYAVLVALTVSSCGKDVVTKRKEMADSLNQQNAGQNGAFYFQFRESTAQRRYKRNEDEDVAFDIPEIVIPGGNKVIPDIHDRRALKENQIGGSDEPDGQSRTLENPVRFFPAGKQKYGCENEVQKNNQFIVIISYIENCIQHSIYPFGSGVQDIFPGAFIRIMAIMFLNPAFYLPQGFCRSSCSSRVFRSSPPAYPVRLPSAPMTRWQGMIRETGL